jgi:AraC-like DNA-binding protein
MIDYCHFSGAGAGSLVRRFRIPTDRAFRPARPEPLAALLRGLAAEYLRHDAHWQELCSLMLAHLLIAFGRGATGIPYDGLTPRQSQLAERLRDLRMRIHQELRARWTIASMAAVAHLSPSRFSHVYRQHFGLSPMDDLIDARVAHARWLLASEPVAVKQAAAECGFCDVHYFSRVFRTRTGCSPQAFARRRASGPRKAVASEQAVENLRVRQGNR